MFSIWIIMSLIFAELENAKYHWYLVCIKKPVCLFLYVNLYIYFSHKSGHWRQTALDFLTFKLHSLVASCRNFYNSYLKYLFVKLLNVSSSLVLISYLKMFIPSLTASKNYKDSDILGLSFVFLVYLCTLFLTLIKILKREYYLIFSYMRKLRLWEVGGFAWSYATVKWWSLDCNLYSFGVFLPEYSIFTCYCS